jgi:hypothetical protein
MWISRTIYYNTMKFCIILICLCVSNVSYSFASSGGMYEVVSFLLIVHWQRYNEVLLNLIFK